MPRLQDSFPTWGEPCSLRWVRQCEAATTTLGRRPFRRSGLCRCIRPPATGHARGREDQRRLSPRMRSYEVAIIVDPDVDDRQVPTLIETHLKVISDGGGTVANTDLAATIGNYLQVGLD